MLSFHKVLLICLACMVLAASAADLYDTNSPVNRINKSNFAKRITNNRKKGISIVHFYSAGDEHSAAYKDEYEQFTKNNKGMYEFGAVNCDDNYDICQKEGITEYPTFRIYPPYPLPTVDLTSDNYSFKKLIKKASKFIENRVIEINMNNYKTFIEDNPGKAKVLLFTENKDTPTLYKALSYNFEKTLLFGIVRSSETALCNKLKVKKFPTIHLVKPGVSKHEVYDGEMNYYGISNFINVYSEIFDFGDSAEQITGSAASKPWMTETLPELTAESAKDICYENKGVCVILFTQGPPSQEQIDTMTNVREDFTSNLEGRGPQFNFMWADAEVQKSWVGTFDIENPSVIMLKPGKRIKYIVHSEDVVTESSLATELSAITGGNARFKKVPDNELPKLEKRQEKA